ncbi:unnamed protein product [Ectocarpus sp. 6 AP-2014]
MTGGTRHVLASEELVYKECEQYLPLRDGDVVYCIKNYDGDTCTIAWVDHRGQKVRSSCRIKGIDTPELRASSKEVKALATRAKIRLRDAVVGEFVTIRDPGKDKYNRVLAGLETEKIGSVAEYMLADPEICKPYQGDKKKSWSVHIINK